MFLRNLFKHSGLASAYNGLRSVVASVYRPIDYGIKTVAGGILKIDSFIKHISDHPGLRDLSGLLTNNPIYGEIINLAKDASDITDLVRVVGSNADQIIRTGLSEPDRGSVPDAGSVARQLGEALD